MMMSRDFCRALARFAFTILSVLGLAAFALGAFLLLYPALFLQVLLYTLGGIMVLFGIGTLGSFLCALLQNKK